MFCSQNKISSILARTIRALRRLSFGGTSGLPLVVKVVKPIKVAGSGFADEFGLDELLVSQAEPQISAAHAAVLREANAAVRQELAGFDLAGRGFNQLAELPTLLFSDRS